jgi:hypothetical protein
MFVDFCRMMRWITLVIRVIDTSKMLRAISVFGRLALCAEDTGMLQIIFILVYFVLRTCDA